MELSEIVAFCRAEYGDLQKVLGTTEQVAEKGLISGAPEKQTPGAALPKKLPVSTDFLSKKKSFWARVEFRRPARLLPTW